MANFNTIVVIMVIYAICHSTALSQDFSIHTLIIQRSLKDIHWL